MSVVVLRAGKAELRLLPSAGGRITACTLVAADGSLQPVLHPYPEGHADLDQWAKGGIYPLVPYHGRIRDAQLAFGGRTWPLTPHAGNPHTLHGIAQRRPWALCEQGVDRARMRYVHQPDAHWPWAFETVLSLRLEPGQVSVGIVLRNAGDAPMPGGIGLHPYLTRLPGDRVVYDAGPAWPFDADYLALLPSIDAEAVQPQQLDADASIGQDVTRFHAGWTGGLRVLSPTGDARLHLHCDGALNQLVLHRPANAPYLCAEPVSHVADGFNLHARGLPGTGTRVLAPGERLHGAMRMAAD
jgi:aldose 1-epimerase